MHGEQVLAQVRALIAGRVPLATELAFGDPAEVVAARAQALGADLIILGSRGLGALDRLLLGSVSAAVAQRAGCSVLIVRTPRLEAAPPPTA